MLAQEEFCQQTVQHTFPIIQMVRKREKYKVMQKECK